MSMTATIDKQIVEKILTRLDQLAQDVKEIKERLPEAEETIEPGYGSDEWWEQQNAQALRDFEEGRYTEVKDEKELQNFFDKLEES